MTMMFVDVRGFTSLAEHLQPVEVVRTLNRLFERIVPVVHLHGGHVDKYAGDGLFAVFGAARRHRDHADRALAAAVQIADVVEDEFAMTSKVNANALPYKGLDLANGDVAYYDAPTIAKSAKDLTPDRVEAAIAAHLKK